MSELIGHTRNSSEKWQRAWTRFNEACHRLQELARQDGDIGLKIDVRLKVRKPTAHITDEEELSK